MKSAKLHILLLALVLAAVALASLPVPAYAIFCWHVDADITCCRLASGQIVCSGG